MAKGIDPEWLGQRLRAIRKERGLTLHEVAAQTKVSVPTLSRIERGGASSLNSGTLITLSDWMGADVAMLKGDPPVLARDQRPIGSTPDMVELHLRADKRLDRKTATALANLFRSVYEQVAQQTHPRKGV